MELGARARSLLEGAACVAVAAALSSGCKPATGAHHAGAEHPLLGASAPALDVPAADGKGNVALADHVGKVVIVDFWATWCEPCRQSFPAYQRLVERAGGKVVVLAVSVDEEPSGIGAFVRETGVKFPVGWDEHQTAAKSYEPPTMPTSFVIDANGIVRFVHAGFSAGDERALESELQSLY